MIKFNSLLNASIFCLFVSGCAASGPIASSDFERLVSKAIPKEDGKSHLSGASEWYPNTRGFNDIRNIILNPPTSPKAGVLAVSDNSVLFLQWEENASTYEPIKRFTCSNLKKASIDSYGLNKRLVLMNNDFSYDSFNFVDKNNIFVETGKIELAAAIINRNCKLY